MNTGVCRLAVSLMITVILTKRYASVAPGYSPYSFTCYDASGRPIPDMATPRQCCLGDGQSYNTSSASERINCTECLVTSGIDIYFVLDEPGSVGSSSYQMMKKFVYDIVNEFDIGPDSTQVGVISFSNFARGRFYLNTYHDKAALLTAINSLPYSGGTTNTAAALDLLRQQGYTQVNGGRLLSQAVPRVAVVITDGRSNDFDATVSAATRVHDEGIAVFSVGVGSDINSVELEAIASDPSYVSTLTGFDTSQFDALRMRISSKVCTTAAEVELNATIRKCIGSGETAYIELSFSDNGITIALEVFNGSVTIYASDQTTTPNEAFYDWMITTGEYIDRFLDPNEIIRTVGDTVYVAITGKEETNCFNFSSTSGDTSTQEKREDCVCPPGGLSILSVCEFFACMDPMDNLKPILGLYDVFVEEGFPCLALVVDTTGGMGDEIEAAKQVIHNFLRSEEYEPGCYVLLPFNDLSNDRFIPASIGEPTIASTYNGILSVVELQNFLAATDAMVATGGGDCPERQLHALLKALAVRDSEGFVVMLPGSHIVMLTDAPSHNLELETEVIRRANEQKVCISFFLSVTGGCITDDGRMMYGRISNSTGGTVTESISQDGFRYFDATHGSTQCADFYGIPLFDERRKRQAPLHDTEMKCHSFATSLFTTSVKVIAHTSQPAVRVMKPTGESVIVPLLYGSFGPVFGEASPPIGEWSVCVDTGTLTISLEKNDVMDSILKYIRPIINSSQSLTTSNPPPACTTGQVSVKTSRIADIESAHIQLLSEGSGEVLVTAPLYVCSDLLLGNITFPRATVKYRIIGNDVIGHPFSISLSNSATFEAGEFRVKTEGEHPVIDPHQTVTIPVTVHNLNKEYVQYTFTYERVTGFLQAFHPSNQLTLAPGMSDSINLIAIATTAEPGLSYTLTATVSDGCSKCSVSKIITIHLPDTTHTPPADVCGCQNGGTCNIRVIRGRVIRRCLCPAEWRGTQCIIPVTE